MVYTTDLKSVASNGLGVQIPLPAPNTHRDNHMHPIKTVSQMPSKLFFQQFFAMTVGEIVHQMTDKDMPYNHDGRYVAGFPVPKFQRQIVWTDEQCIKLIESMWLGFNIGSYTLNHWKFVGQKMHPFSHYVLDGQQRLRAIERYVKNEFPVFGMKYFELNVEDTRRFNGIHFSRGEVKIWDEPTLRELYNRMNFSGTVHTIDEMV